MTLKVGMQHPLLKYYQVCSNDDPGLTLTYFTARSNLVPYAFVWENGKTLGFSEAESVISKLVDAALDLIYTGLVTTVQVLYLLEICCRG